MDETFIRLKVVEDIVYNEREFLQSFNERCQARKFPITIKIDEAPDLHNLRLGDMKIIDFVKQSPFSKHIVIETDNLVQQVPGVFIKKWFNELPFFHFKPAKPGVKRLQKKFMLFVGNHRWPRFLLGEFLHSGHREESYITYWHKYVPSDSITDHLTVKRIDRFRKCLPLYVNSNENIKRHSDGYINFTDTNALVEFYQKGFLDCVCETWHSGDTFLPTEKIARPLALKNPFIVFGPRHFLMNLRRMGFKTFNNYWSEEYDNHEGIERINLIKKQLVSISEKTLDELKTLQNDMGGILDHNQKLYQNITLDSINTEFSSRLT